MPISYDYAGAAAMVGVSESKVRTWVRNNDIAARYAGKDVLIEHDELVRFVKTLPTSRN